MHSKHQKRILIMQHHKISFQGVQLNINLKHLAIFF